MGEPAAGCNTLNLAVDQKIGVNRSLESRSCAEAQYIVSRDHVHKKRPIRIICIGVGIAGIAAANKYKRRLSEVVFKIDEKSHEVGGT
ncbi:uncharacterized protein PV07_07202 [Cladophialophora immunda]|uniref:Uncharacterized protein n=1 Tax=Cladophialophora immunda TaxID=569365 RepID=A0A0D2C8S0_9EURO|nr:uncharacterized protein PV07_07202 [Cladophialophora immunda]KIW27468.1 hypothetical protein PV07_07202 [Cladophialophora immunda]